MFSYTAGHTCTSSTYILASIWCEPIQKGTQWVNAPMYCFKVGVYSKQIGGVASACLSGSGQNAGGISVECQWNAFKFHILPATGCPTQSNRVFFPGLCVVLIFSTSQT